MKWWGGGGGGLGVAVNIEWGTLPYGVKVEGRGEVCVWGGVGWVTLPHPILPYGVHVGYKTDQEMKCGGG